MTLIPNLSQNNPLHNLPPYSFKLHFHLTFLFMFSSFKRSLYWMLATRTLPPLKFASAPQVPQAATISFSVLVKSRDISENLNVWEFFYNLNISLSPCLTSRMGHKACLACFLQIIPETWPASWSSGQSPWLLIMRSRVRFPALPWEFSLKGKIPAVTMVWVD